MGLTDAASLLSNLFARSPDGYALLDRNLMIQFANDALGLLSLLSAEQLVGKSVETAIPGWSDHLAVLCRRARETGEPVQSVESLPQASGQSAGGRIYLEITVSPILGPAGLLEGYLLTARRASGEARELERHRLDKLESLWRRFRWRSEASRVKSGEATTRNAGMRAEERALRETRRALAELELRYRTLLDSIDDGIHVKDVAGRYVMVNPEMARRVGRPRDEILGKSPWDIHDARHAQEVVEQHEEVLKTGQPMEADIEYTERERAKYYRVRRVPLRNDEGEIVGVVTVARDSTAQRSAELERERLLEVVRHQALELQTIISSAAEGVVVYGPGGEVLRSNPAAAEMLACAPGEPVPSLEEWLACYSIETMDGAVMSKEDTPAWRALHGEVVVGTIMVMHSPGRNVWLSGSASPLRSPEGELRGAVAVFTDISELCRLQERQTDYLRLVSHDLRSPLSVATGYIAMLSPRIEQSGDEFSIRYMRGITVSLHRINTLIQDLVDCTRLESGQLQLNLEPIELGRFMPQLLELYEVAMNVERIRFDLPEDLPAVSADASRLERIILNLLTNALKYSSPPEEVLVTARPGPGEVTISVIDRGEGIAEQDLPHLFDRFYRPGRGRKSGGLGLGLYITKGLVEAHGGRIWVESQTEGGSIFSFTLPVIHDEE